MARRGPVKSSKLFPVEMTASFRSTSSFFFIFYPGYVIVFITARNVRLCPFVPFVAKVLLRVFLILERHVAILDIANAEGAKSNALYS